MNLFKKFIKYKPHKTEKEEIEKLSPRRLKIRQKKAAAEKKIGRRVVGVAFLVTVGLGLISVLGSELAGWRERLTSPAVIATLPEETDSELALVEGEIEGLVKGKTGRYGVYVKYRGRERSVGINKNEVFPAASLIKLPVMVALYREAEAGRVSLDEEYKLTEEDKVGGAGVLAGKPTGTVFSYRQLVQLMAHYSDNTAYKVARRRLGDKIIQETIDKLGMSRTSLAKNETTPADTGLLWEKLQEGRVLAEANRKELLGFLTETAFEDRIPGGVPAGTRVAHKVGTDLGIYSDSGIVYPPVGGQANSFVIVVMSKEAREAEARKVAVNVAKVAFDFEIGLTKESK